MTERRSTAESSARHKAQTRRHRGASEVMLLDNLNALMLAGEDALHTCCGLTVTGRGVSLLGQGSLTFPALAELTVRNGPLQKVHLGCDPPLCAKLGVPDGKGADRTGIEKLTARFLQQLIGRFEARNPRGSVRHLDIGVTTLASRGRRSFGIRLETEAGRLFMLTELPSRMEMEQARKSEYLAAMESAYLPCGWESHTAIDDIRAIEDFLVFLRKVEADVVFEVPGEDRIGRVHTGLLLDNGTHRGVRGLKFCTDLPIPGEDGLEAGAEIFATVGVGERSLQFVMRYLGGTAHPLVNGAELPAAIFQPPEQVTIAQRRLAFRIPVRDAIPVRLVSDRGETSPWGDGADEGGPLLDGVLADLSFSGARMVADERTGQTSVELNRKVHCLLEFEDFDEPLCVLAIVRRSTSRLVDRNRRQLEVGLEFLISQDTDREVLDFVRDFVLAEQRARLAQRIQLTGV